MDWWFLASYLFLGFCAQFPLIGFVAGWTMFGLRHIKFRILVVVAYYVCFYIGFGFVQEMAIFPAGIVGIPLGLFMLIKRRPRRFRFRCATCGYDLRVVTDRCPECGAVNEEFQLRRAAESLTHIEVDKEIPPNGDEAE